MLTFYDASIGYGRRVLLSCLELKILPGETIFLMGANGSGKSTLAKCLIGALPLLAGRRESTFQRLAYVPQSSRFEVEYPITVAELIEQGLQNYATWRLYRRQKGREQCQSMIAQLGLFSCQNALLREASGGELQRALIARALIGQPDFLVLDEPFSNLDRLARDETARLLADYARAGATLCVIDHGDALEHDFYSRVWEIEDQHLREKKRSP